MFSELVEDFLQVWDEIFLGFCLDQHVFLIDFQYASYQVFEYLVHEPLVGEACVFQPEWHHFIVKVSNKGDKRPAPISRPVELGFKEARPWPGNVKFQFWPSFNVLQQRKVAYATLENWIRNSCPKSSPKASGEEFAYACLKVVYATWSEQNQKLLFVPMLRAQLR
ncbi:hypothetical protein PIB30_065560 [Stylosanthes scabra]|uniref:Uncharacterized protein n=1 Tax=Stylosanthes scabra TaxID=79078 RepID=A0ABU6ZKQ8_9FABA|nr:hypothetical protein [Stylosanthes scabra]